MLETELPFAFLLLWGYYGLSAPYVLLFLLFLLFWPGLPFSVFPPSFSPCSSSFPTSRVSHLFLSSWTGLAFVEASSVLLAFGFDSPHLLDWTCFPDWTACRYLIDGSSFLAVSCALESSLTDSDRDCRFWMGGFNCRRSSWVQRWAGRTAWGHSNPAAQRAQLIDQLQCVEAFMLPPKGWIQPKCHDITVTL